MLHESTENIVKNVNMITTIFGILLVILCASIFSLKNVRNSRTMEIAGWCLHTKEVGASWKVGAFLPKGFSASCEWVLAKKHM